MHTAEFHVPQGSTPVTACPGICESPDNAICLTSQNGLPQRRIPMIVDDNVLVDKGDPFRCRQCQPTIARRPGIKALRRMQYRHALDLGKTARWIAVTAVRNDDRSDTWRLSLQRRDDLL